MVITLITGDGDSDGRLTTVHKIFWALIFFKECGWKVRKRFGIICKIILLEGEYIIENEFGKKIEVFEEQGSDRD